MAPTHRGRFHLHLTAYVLLFVAICFSVSGELLLKHGMNQVGALSLQPSAIIQGLITTFSHPAVLGGFALIFGGSIFWLAVISRVNLSVAYPMLSMGYILVVFLSWLFLNEQITIHRFAGVLVICAGVVMINWS